MTKKHLVLLHQHFSPPDGFGNNRSLELATQWAKEGYQVTVVCGAGNFSIKTSQCLVFDTITVLVLPVDYHHFMRFYKRIWSFLRFVFLANKKLNTLPAIYLLYAVSTPLTVGWLALRRFKQYQTPYFFEIGDLWPDVPIDMGILKNGWLKKYLYKIEANVYQHASKIICLSPGIQDYLIHHKKISATSIVTSVNGTNVDLFRPTEEKDNIRKQLGLPQDAFILLYAGTIGKANGIERIVELSSYLAPYTSIYFYFIGDGNDADKIKKLLQNKEHPSIKWIPPVSKKEVIPWIQAADIGIVSYTHVPILGTNSANKFYDYLACGLPVIVNLKGWQGEWLKEYDCGIGSDAPEDLIPYILDLYQSKEHYLTASQNARRLAEERFHRPMLASQLADLFFSR